MKKLSYLTGVLLMVMALGCQPDTSTEEGKEAVQNDTLDPREGEGEGEPGPEEIGGYKHNQ